MPKMIKNRFYKELTYENIEKAYCKCKKNKKYKSEVIQFEMVKEYKLKKMYEDLKNGEYKFGKYKEFTIKTPKERKILAAPFCDRIVHTWYVKSFLEKIFVPQFIPTTYACILNKGTLKCVFDVKRAMHNMSEDAYLLKMDVSKFFNNIDKDILYNIICRKIKDKDILDLTKKILNSTERMPIGNYTSQMFANIYLNEVDQFAKHILKCKKYYRYMDDSVIFCETKEQAKYYLREIESFLNDKLKLTLNSKTNIIKVSKGFNFVGYKIFKDYVKIKNRPKHNLYRKVKYIAKNHIEDYDHLIACHRGYILNADSYRVIQGIKERYGVDLIRQ